VLPTDFSFLFFSFLSPAAVLGHALSGTENSGTLHVCFLLLFLAFFFFSVFFLFQNPHSSPKKDRKREKKMSGF